MTAAAVIEINFAFGQFGLIGGIPRDAGGVELGVLIQAGIGSRLVAGTVGRQNHLAVAPKLVVFGHGQVATDGAEVDQHSFVAF